MHANWAPKDVADQVRASWRLENCAVQVLTTADLACVGPSHHAGVCCVDQHPPHHFADLVAVE